MTPEIKQRITQLDNGEVPNGYEKTEIGTFPVGWKTTTLDKLLEFKNGVNADKEKYNSGVKMISVMDILSDSPIYYDKIKGQVDIDEKTLDTYSVTYGDILFQRSSETFEDAGKSNVYLDKDRTATYSGFVIRGKKKADYNPYFLNEALRIGQVRNQIIRNAAGSQHINVGQDSLVKIIVPLASDIEQSKIAEILMKWDEAIELQERIIKWVKKRRGTIISNIFANSNNWIPYKLSDLCKTVGGGTPSTKNESYWTGTTPWVSSSDLFEEDIHTLSISRHISEAAIESSATHIVPSNSILLVSRVGLGKLVLTQTPVCTSQDFCNLYDISCDSYFLAYYLQNTLKRIVAEAQGTSIKGLSGNEIRNIEIRLPDQTLQLKVANLLKESDKIIQLETEKLHLLNKQRQTLQQYLLNGIVRV